MPDSKHAQMARYQGDYNSDKLMSAIDEADETPRIALEGQVQSAHYIELYPTDTSDHVAEHTEFARNRTPQPVMAWYRLVPPVRHIELDRDAA